MNKILIWNKLQKIVQDNGGKCISNNYVNNTSKLSFECRIGHKWDTSWKNINKGAWCPECFKIKMRGANNSRYDSICNMIKIAEERGGKCLSSNYNGAHFKLEWECMLGHKWFAKPNSIKNGTWCAKCSEGIGERICRLIFETIFKEKFIKIRPSWLKNSITNRNLELDGFCEKLNIAFEYNGKQHYADSTIFSRSLYDIEKIKKCHEKNVKLFIIQELSSISKYKKIICEIKTQAVKFNINFNNDIKIPINEVYRTTSSIIYLDELNTIAKIRGGFCLSNNYIDSSFKLDFKCGKCSFIWKASPNGIKNGQWCPNCASKYISLENAQSLAFSKNGKCLSNKYINSTIKMYWECEFKHSWLASYNQIQSGNWCPICFKNNRGKNKRLSIFLYKEAAIKKDGICMSNNINSCYDKLLWKCVNNHEWIARADLIKNTKQWCPICAKIKRKK